MVVVICISVDHLPSPPECWIFPPIKTVQVTTLLYFGDIKSNIAHTALGLLYSEYISIRALITIRSSLGSLSSRFKIHLMA